MSDQSNGGGKKNDAVQIINPPHPLKHKVSGGGGPSPEMLAKAEAAIAKMSDDYPNWASKDVETLSALVARIEPGVDNEAEPVREAFRLAHDMRGQGGSFGYPLMTRIANSFCRFTEKVDVLDAGGVGILETHVNAMRAIVGNRVKGTGGEMGDQIADGLDAAVRKYLAKRGTA
ncbi:MAG: phosphorelay protein [Marivibrio sp.]|uniref:phosphorelay protein n=1 Tax=Marivibrio sp. TaxID=2039719 RepID=UPI0032EFA1D5